MVSTFVRMAVLVDGFDLALWSHGTSWASNPVYDGELDGGTRILYVCLPDQDPAGLWLLESQAASSEMRVGDQTGGEPAMVPVTDDLSDDHERLVLADIDCARSPVETPDDVRVHYHDPFGNELVLA